MRFSSFTLFLTASLAFGTALRAGEPEWRLTNPAYLYLEVHYQGIPDSALTWLQPARKREGEFCEAIAPNQTEPAKAFSFSFQRDTRQGYEVVFRPIDPQSLLEHHPVDGPVSTVIFPRSERKRVQITPKLFVVGFYGDPKLAGH